MNRRVKETYSMVVAAVFIAMLIAEMPANAGHHVAQAVPRQSTGHSARKEQVVPGVVILKLKPGYALPTGGLSKAGGPLVSVLLSNGLSSVRPAFPALPGLSKENLAAGRIDLSQVYFATIPPGENPFDVSARIARLHEVAYAEPKYIHYVDDVPNDPLISNQGLAFARLNIANGWSVAKGARSVVIADVDGGTYWQHEDLSPNLWINSAEDFNDNGRYDPTPSSAGGDLNGVDDDGNGFVDDVIGWNFTNSSGNPNGVLPNSFSHGTATASHFAAATNNGIGMAGTSWNCSLMPICTASATADNSIEFGYEGIAYAYRNGAKIINCSWGRVGGFSQFEQDVINAATQAGTLVVASAGNDQSLSDLNPQYPANYANVLAVGATNSLDDAKASFSNYGTNVTVYAPGVSIWSAFTDGSYGNGGSGTSYSSPLVAGIAGILKSMHPSWTPGQLAAQLRVTADPIDGAINPGLGGLLGHGRVNAARAFSESHPGLVIVRTDLKTLAGKSIFLTGDTLSLSVTVKNILGSPATNVQFAVSVPDLGLNIIQGTASIAQLDSGQQVQLPDFRFVVSPLDSSKNIVFRLIWLSNGVDHDAYAWRTTIFPSAPSWLTQQSPTETSLFSSKAVDTRVVWAVGGNSRATAPVAVRTMDAGNIWEDVTGNLTGVDLYCVIALDSNRAWAGTGNGKIYATTNGGRQWHEQAYPGTQTTFIDGIWFFDANNGFAVGDPPNALGHWVVLKTTDGGATWSHIANEPVGDAGEGGWNNSFWWTDTFHGWFGTNKNKIWRTTDGGNSWTSAIDVGTNSYGVSFTDINHGIAVHDAGGIGVTTDGGVSWNLVTLPAQPQLPAAACVPGTRLNWITNGDAPFRSTDNGLSWNKQSAYPFSGALQHISFSDTSHGWGVTSNGEILRYNPDILLTGVPQTPVVQTPRSFFLEQNYPNPFNPATTIGYEITVASRVTLQVFDLLGREVALLVDEEKTPGRYTTVFDARQTGGQASGIASGVYIYRLKTRPSVAGSTEAFVQVRKMLVLR